jgi:hypothetical protein
LPETPRLRVSVAYDLPSGNPLKKWSSFDFEFGKSPQLKLSGKSVKVVPQAGNILVLTVDGEKFSFGAEGFDEHRDLLVRIDELPADEIAEEVES